MKLALIVPGFSADERDWCIPALRDLARSLAAAHDAYVLALRYPHRSDTYRAAGALVRSLNGQTRRGAASLQLWAAALAALAREHRRARFDLVHAVYGGEAGFLAVLAAQLLHVPSVVSLVGGELAGLGDIGYGAELRPRQRLMNELTLRRADAILGGSDQVTRAARLRVSPARRARVQTLPLGVDTRMFSPAPASARRGLQILNVGSLIPVKDQETLLHAMALFRQSSPDARLTIAGSGPLRDSLGQLAARLGLGACVEFAGTVAHEDLPGLYRQAALVVQSSRHEGEGMAVLEAAACGAALAGTAVGVLADLAGRGAAVAVPPADPAALARAMQQACAARASLGERALDLVRREYDLARIERRLMELYRTLENHHAVNVISTLTDS